MEKKDKQDKREQMEKKEKPVTVHITNHNQFHKGVGAFITNLNHLTLVMDAEGNMKMDMGLPMQPQTTVETEGESDDDETGEVEGDEEKNLNFKSPTIALQRMLEGGWFDIVSTNKELYNKEWRNKLVADLMASEHGAYIAKLWEKQRQRNKVKGQFVGALKEAGVMKGSDTFIARAVLGVADNTKDEEEKKEANTLGKNIGRWKNEPYVDWVKKYVDKTPQKE